MSDLTDISKGTMRPWARAVVRYPWYAFFWLFRHMRVSGVENIPKEGPFILIANHLHNFDPLLTQIPLKRNCHFFVKQEALDSRLFSLVVHWTGGIPVNRGTPDRKAIRHAEAALAQGLGVGVYPEGTRSTTFSLQQGLAGAGLIAMRSDAPIIPLAITGSERLPFNGKKGKLRAGRKMPESGYKGIRLIYGPAFQIEKTRDGKRITAAEATDQIMLVLAKMLPPDYRGVYADRVPDESTAESA